MKVLLTAFFIMSCAKASPQDEISPTALVIKAPDDEPASSPRSQPDLDEQEVKRLTGVVIYQQSVMAEKDALIWYYMHASNRRPDFNARFGSLKNNPKISYMFLVETEYLGKRVEFFISGDEAFANLVAAFHEDKDQIDDVEKALGLALQNDSENHVKFYFSKDSGLPFKGECDNNPGLANYYHYDKPIPPSCTVLPEQDHFNELKDALLTSGHFDLTKIFAGEYK